jgi:uncharacterized surface protein with fasciclin (FAS1) repeats
VIREPSGLRIIGEPFCCTLCCRAVARSADRSVAPSAQDIAEDLTIPETGTQQTLNRARNVDETTDHIRTLIGVHLTRSSCMTVRRPRSSPRLNPVRAVAMLAVLVVAVAACGDDDDAAAPVSTSTTVSTTAVATAPAAADATQTPAVAADLLEVAAAEGDLGTFLGALGAAGIMDGLHGPGPFTVFVPTDTAFADYLAEAGMSQTELFADPALLVSVLDYHLVEMIESSEQVMGMAGQSFVTASGAELAVTVDGDRVMVGNATVERYDIQASNGVIHVIDAVLVPPQQ